jgi:hypothetical protein
MGYPWLIIIYILLSGMEMSINNLIFFKFLGELEIVNFVVNKKKKRTNKSEFSMECFHCYCLINPPIAKHLPKCVI